MNNLTSKDIAALAGVSRSTVSRVVNGYSNVPEETRKKVMEVIKEHHYYPQLSGQLLKGMRTRTIGIFWIGDAYFSTNPLLANYLLSIIDACTKRGYLVLTCLQKDIDAEGTRNFIRKTFIEKRIDAGIFIGIDNNEHLIDQLAESGQFVGLFDFFHKNEDVPNRFTVNLHGSTAELSVDYLYKLGHRKIAVIDGDLSRISCFNRHESYLRGLRKHNLPIRNKWLAYGGLNTMTGYESALTMLRACEGDRPTAVCAHNDAVALGVYRACVELGLKIPEDISVIGTDGCPSGEISAPPLTTFAFDFSAVFSSLVNRLIDAVEAKDNIPADEVFQGYLIERASCRRIREVLEGEECSGTA